MADNTPRLLTVAVTSRALFDLEESHALYEREGVQAYSDFQRHHEDDVLAPGIAFPVVRKLLARKGAVVHFLIRKESEGKVAGLREYWGVGAARAVGPCAHVGRP